MASAGTLMPSAKILLLLLVFVIHFYKEWKILGFRNYSLYKQIFYIKKQMLHSNKYLLQGIKIPWYGNKKCRKADLSDKKQSRTNLYTKYQIIMKHNFGQIGWETNTDIQNIQ